MIDEHKDRYTKIFPEVTSYFVHDDVGVTKMVGFLSSNLLKTGKFDLRAG